MSRWENALIDDCTTREIFPISSPHQNAGSRHSSRRPTLLHDTVPQESQVPSQRPNYRATSAATSHQRLAKATKRSHRRTLGNETSSNNGRVVSVEPQYSHYVRGSPVRRRPPLARLPQIRVPPSELRLQKSFNEGPRLQEPLSQILHTNPIAQNSGSSPRKLLWPTDAPNLVPPRDTSIPIHQTDAYRLRSHQGFKPHKRRQPLVPDIPRAIPPKFGDQPSIAQLSRISERKKLSNAEQRYHPMDQLQAEKLRNNVQTRLQANSNHSTAQTKTCYDLNPSLDEPQSTLIEHLVQRLPESPPTLHLHSSPQPPNPGSPRKMSPTTAARVPVSKSERPPSLLIPEHLQHDPPPSMRKMLRWEIWLYRIVFSTVIVVLNISILIVYLLTPRHHYLLAFLVFMKSKDLLSTVAGIFGNLWTTLREWLWPPGDVDSKWIMSVVCAYAETESQIVRTTQTLVDQELVQHNQVICIILDGKQRNVLSHFTQITHMMERPCPTWKGVENNLQVHAGFIKNTPVILIQKDKNAGKKDTLILGHSLFNYPRDDAPTHIKLLRRDIFAHVLPDLTGVEGFKSFDYVYATDADSTIHKDCLKELANALSRNTKAIAACGIILAQLDAASEWSAWHLFQQFQYTFGQYVRRQAESVWGRVTCLPGPVTMITVRREMGPAISEYAAPVTSPNLFLHQVQYQGTDRRLTWCMLAQGKHLQTILVTKAVGETVVPSSLDHYLSQRRRWAANAYFNDYMYAFGKEQRLITRLFGVIDIIRMSFVYYRVMNTALFIRSLIRVFYMLKIIPTLIMTKSPTTWFLLLILLREPLLRKRLHKLLCGIALNQFMSPVLSVIVFSRVLLNMGNHAWGKTGVSSVDTTAISTIHIAAPIPESPWSPRKLVNIIRKAIQDSGSQVVNHKSLTEQSILQTNNSVSGETISHLTPTTTENLNKSEKVASLAMPQTPPGRVLKSTATPTGSVRSTTASVKSTVRRRTRHRNDSAFHQLPSPALRLAATPSRSS